jgi:DNA-binding NarL/FixJ family response regulator
MLQKIGYKILATASNGKQFLPLLDQQQPDIVIMDIAMPVMDGYEASCKAIEKYPDLKILVLSSLTDQKHYYQMIQAGVKGFVVKNAGINELKLAIAEIIGGGSWFSNELLQNVIFSMKKVAIEESKIKLTDRETEVLKLICNGLSAEKIAGQLNLSTDTIRTYRANLLSKTECPNAPALVMYAIRNKLIEI